MAEHVDLERTIRPRPDGGDHLPGGLGIDRPDADGTEPAGIRHRGGHFGRGNARHWGLDDRQLDSELAEERAHGFLFTWLLLRTRLIVPPKQIGDHNRGGHSVKSVYSVCANLAGAALRTVHGISDASIENLKNLSARNLLWGYD